MKRKILTVKNQAVLYKKLKAYLEEILELEYAWTYYLQRTF